MYCGKSPVLAGILFFLMTTTPGAAFGNSLQTPNISANALFLYRNSNYQTGALSTERNGIDLQEAELDFYGDVDPYSRFFMVLSVAPKYAIDTTGAKPKVNEDFGVDPEELFAESTAVSDVTLKIGKFKAALGKHNLLHTHAYQFVDAPLFQKVLLGDEGLNDVGASAAGLLPTPWFSEVTAQFLRGEGGNAEFSSSTPGDGVGLLHWKNLVDLSDELTGEIGASYAGGQNSLDTTTTLSGADLTFRWRPTSGGRYHSWILQSEFIRRNVVQPGTSDEVGQGIDLWAQYQFAERWAVLARVEQLKIDGSSAAANPNALTNDTTRKHSFAFNFSPSEFSSFKLEYDGLNGPDTVYGRNEKKVYLQANFLIGAHPAHGY